MPLLQQINRVKILNGTDSAWNNSRSPDKVPNPEDGKFFDNELVVSNGGIGDKSSPTPPSQTGIYPFVSGINNFKLSNGRNFQNLANNNISFDNGIGVLEGVNMTTINNGSINNNGANIIRINNEGMVGADNVENSITINNDHQQQNLKDFFIHHPFHYLHFL